MYKYRYRYGYRKSQIRNHKSQISISKSEIFRLYKVHVSSLFAQQVDSLPFYISSFWCCVMENCILLKYDVNPIPLHECACKEIAYPKNDKYMCGSYQSKLARRSNSKEESGVRSGGGGNKAMNCSRRRVLACIACASDRCNAIDILSRNHVQCKLSFGVEHQNTIMFDNSF